MMSLSATCAGRLGILSAALYAGLAAQLPTAPASVQVRVIDEAGNAVAGEMVVLQINDGQEIIDEIVASSAADGAVLFEEVPTAEGYVAVPFG